MSNQDLNVTSKHQITLPSTESEKRIAIRFIDWNRLKRYIDEKQESIFNLSIPYSILYGVSGSAGLSLIPLFFSTGLPSWTIPLYICITLFSLLCAIIFNILDYTFKKKVCEDKKNISTEMIEIENTFEKENKNEEK